VKDKPVGRTTDQPPPREPPDDAQLEREQLLDISRRLLRTADEKEARRIIAAGWPEGTPDFEAFLQHWRQNREKEGWQKS
jgi:hypothetical protein